MWYHNSIRIGRYYHAKRRYCWKFWTWSYHVKAPYVRLISEEVGPKGDIITNFDIRLIQPNENSIDTGGLHTIEHLLAKLIRQRIDGLIDCSPFGCRTASTWLCGENKILQKLLKLSNLVLKLLLTRLHGKSSRNYHWILW